MLSDTERYARAAHGVRTAIAIMIERDPTFVTPKHTRVGIDMSKSDQAGLATLLIAKGVFTLDEYTKAMADAAEVERARYEKDLFDRFGIKVRLA